jgi:hypothetical protein
VASAKWKALINPILVLSLVLAIVLALPGVSCSATPSPAKNTDSSTTPISPQAGSGVSSSSMPAGISLTVSEPHDNIITDVTTIEVKGTPMQGQ